MSVSVLVIEAYSIISNVINLLRGMGKHKVKTGKTARIKIKMGLQRTYFIGEDKIGEKRKSK